MRQCIPILMVPLYFLGEMGYLNNLGKSVVLILYSQLPFLQSEATISKQSELDWGAIGSCEFIKCSWCWKPISKLNYAQAQGLSLEDWSAIEKLAAWTWWILFWCVFERSTPASFQSNSSCLEINHFRKTTTSSVNFAQYFQEESCWKTIFFKKYRGSIRIWMHSHIFIYQRLKWVT